MLTTIFGLPLHPLIVHATVVMVPLAALCTLLAVVWPRFRQWFGWGPLALAAVAVVLDPLSTQSGESLEHQIGRSALVEQHSELADGLLPWLLFLFVAAAAVVAWRYSGTRLVRGWDVPRWLRIATVVAGVVAALGTLVWVVLVGHSGAEAVWNK